MRLYKRARTNCQSAHDPPKVVGRYLDNKLALG